MTAEDILCDLIRLRTDALTKSNRPFVDYVCAALSAHDILFQRIPNPVGAGENILAGVNITSLENIQGGLILSGHMDTVGANPNDWAFPPFEARRVAGRIYGRGALDMKYFIAVVLSLLSEIKTLQIPVFLVFTCDEETEVKGIESVLDFMKARHISPRFALVGEPTHFDLCVANRGYAGYTTVVKGVAAHSGSPKLGVNAAYIGAKLISKIEALNETYTAQGATLNVGVLKGGVGRNSVPDEVTLDWEIRFEKEETKALILAELQTFHQVLLTEYSRANLSLKTAEQLPSFEEKKESALVKLVGRILGTKTFSLPYATEAGFFQKAGIDTLICGAGDEKLAHTSAEYMEEQDVQQYVVFLQNFLRAASALT